MPGLEFNSEIGSMSTEQLDELFTGVEGTPSADDLKLGKAVNEDGKLEELGNDADDLFDDAEKSLEEIEKAKLEKVKAEKLVAEQKAKEEQEKLEASKSEEQKLTDKKLAEEKVKAELAAKELEKNAPIVKEALTNTVNYLVESGVWADFEGREELEVTPEIYQQLVIEQDKIRLSSQFDQLIDSTGDYGKAIIAHIKQGGNPDDIIDIFKEQQQLEQIDTSTEQGKTTKIEKYYKDILGWKDEKVQKYIKRIVADDEVETEFTEVEERYNQYYKQQLEAVNRDAQEQAKKVTEKREQFKTGIKSALSKEDKLTPQERRLIETSILDFKHDLGNGQRVNDFYIKFAEIQKDPTEYIELVRFVMDKENYKKTLKETVETAAARKEFAFIKNNGAITKVGTKVKDKEDKSGSQSGTNFAFVVK